MDTTLCEDDDVNASFTCVLFFLSGTPVSPVWLRNGGGFDTMRHMVVNNLTSGLTGPAYISSTITVDNVTILDDGALYDCRFVTVISNSGTLNVVGEYIHTCIRIYVYHYFVCSICCIICSYVAILE